MSRTICAVVVAALTVASCGPFYGRSGDNKEISSDPRLVLTAGDTVKAKLPYGTIAITSDGGLTRTYSWDNGECQGTLDLQMRSEPWLGVDGGYNPGASLPPWWQWGACNGVRRGVVEEGHADFADVESFQAWFEDRYVRWFGKNVNNRVAYTDDGLLITYSKALSRYQLNAEVIQILINGQKPTSLPGSNNTLISYRTSE